MSALRARAAVTAAAQERLDASVVMRTYVILLTYPSLSLAYVHRALLGVSQTWPRQCGAIFYALLSAPRDVVDNSNARTCKRETVVLISG